VDAPTQFRDDRRRRSGLHPIATRRRATHAALHARSPAVKVLTKLVMELAR
jgi:hypothetical protein